MEAGVRGRPRSAEVDERILRVTLDHLRAGGYRELSMEQVAADAGVGKATVYRRYRNKADLATAAVARVSAAKLAGPPPEDTREALIDHARRFESGVAHVGLGVIASLLEERDGEALRLHRERTISHGRERALSILRRARERGEIRADADLDAATQMLFGSLLARRLIGDEGGDWPETVVATLLRGLAR